MKKQKVEKQKSKNKKRRKGTDRLYVRQVINAITLRCRG